MVACTFYSVLTRKSAEGAELRKVVYRPDRNVDYDGKPSVQILSDDLAVFFTKVRLEQSPLHFITSSFKKETIISTSLLKSYHEGVKLQLPPGGAQCFDGAKSAYLLCFMIKLSTTFVHNNIKILI